MRLCEQKNRSVIILIALSAIFFFIYAWFPYLTTRNQAYFASPDATANYLWIERFAQGKELFYTEPLNLITDDMVVPRSLRSDDGLVKPVSFLGMIFVYGYIAKFLGMWIVPYLTVFFAIVGAWFFYGIIKIIFNNYIAWWSALMLLMLPPYWYYAARGLFHNVLFTVMLMAGVYFFIKYSSPSKPTASLRRYINPIGLGIAGVFIGLAVFTRTSEVIWLVPTMLLIAIIYCQKICQPKFIIFFLGLGLALIPIFYYNQILYGNYFNFGYESVADNIDRFYQTSVNTGVGVSVQSIISAKIIPFGLDFKSASRHFFEYYVQIFWYLFWPAFGGGLLWLRNWSSLDMRKKTYFIIFILVSFILGIFYGSWNINDSVAKNTITIGNSYTRYWLPIYIMSIPLAIIAWQWLAIFLSQFLIKHNWREFKVKIKLLDITDSMLDNNIKSVTVMLVVVMLLVLFFSQSTVIFSSGEGLNATVNSLAVNQELTVDVLRYIDSDAVVITPNLDKFIWPSRKVISKDIFAPATHVAVTKLLNIKVPVYYYGFILRPEHLSLLNDQSLAEFFLKIKPIKIYNKNKLGLYQITGDEK